MAAWVAPSASITVTPGPKTDASIVGDGQRRIDAFSQPGVRVHDLAVTRRSRHLGPSAAVRAPRAQIVAGAHPAPGFRSAACGQPAGYLCQG
jgi:hypothetical protein